MQSSEAKTQQQQGYLSVLLKINSDNVGHTINEHARDFSTCLYNDIYQQFNGNGAASEVTVLSTIIFLPISDPLTADDKHRVSSYYCQCINA